MRLVERVPPHDLEAEQAVLASCLMDAYAAHTAADLLNPEDFYQAAHQHIYRAIASLQARHQPVDLITIRDTLGAAEKLEEVGGYGYLVDLLSSIPTTAHLPHYAAIVSKKAERRRAIQALMTGLDSLYDPDAPDPVTETLGSLMSVSAARRGETAIDFHEAVAARTQEISDRVTGKRAAPESAFTFGLYDLDQKLRIEEQDMIVIGARPSSGKTALALQVMTHVAKSKPVLFFSLEMSKRAMASRFLSLRTGIGIKQQMAGVLSSDDLANVERAYVDAASLQYVIDDRPGLSVAQMTATIQRSSVQRGEPYGLIVVDHMGKVKPADARGSKHHQISQISNDLKNLARSTGTPVLVLNQLNRSSAKDDREPRLDDLRESGSIEEDADVILLLHRPDRDQDKTEAKLIIGKNRNGPCGAVEMVFEGARTQFVCKSYEVPTWQH